MYYANHRLRKTSLQRNIGDYQPPEKLIRRDTTVVTDIAAITRINPISMPAALPATTTSLLMRLRITLHLREAVIGIPGTTTYSPVLCNILH